MAKRFELHLKGMDAPEGLIDADRLIEIVKSLQEMATRLGRIETDSAPRGRPSKSLDRVAGLRIGLDKGSTTIIAERDVDTGAFALDLPDEEAVDRQFGELIDSVGADHRPDWVTDSLANTAGDLVAALQRTTPKVELKVDGVSSRTFETGALRRQTWQPLRSPQPAETVRFTGRLFAVNLNTHRLQVEDDVGHQVALPKVLNDREVGKLVGGYVTVTGAPEADPAGRLTRINDASVQAAVDPSNGQQPPSGITLEEILAQAAGPIPGGIAGLTDNEIEAYLEAIE